MLVRIQTKLSIFWFCFSFQNNRFSGPELQGLVPYDFGC
ncbi:hypothetical protein CK203_052435 [Vitis vinifera]|uniref:Uncharacterized protein n=1 Tax=Vitis vinifera TaxID=29760 RepID=A0A438H6M9_VITVI|nr:hypothetical protein CK203_052435 [Vitis vinifera]